jgi:hypothetical protein
MSGVDRLLQTGSYGVPTGFPLIPRVLRRPMRVRKTADTSGDSVWDAGVPEPSIPSGITGLRLRARWWTPQPGRKNNGGEAEIRTLERVANSSASTGQKHARRGRCKPGRPASGRQLRTQFCHCTGTALLPCTAPSSVPQMGALVSVSPPRITVGLCR